MQDWGNCTQRTQKLRISPKEICTDGAFLQSSWEKISHEIKHSQKGSHIIHLISQKYNQLKAIYRNSLITFIADLPGKYCEGMLHGSFFKPFTVFIKLGEKATSHWFGNVSILTGSQMKQKEQISYVWIQNMQDFKETKKFCHMNKKNFFFMWQE